MDKGMAQVDLAIMSSMASAEHDFRSIMLLAREMQGGDFVIDAGTLKTIEDLLFVARSNLQLVNIRISERLSQYRDLAQAACEAVKELDDVEEDRPSNVVPLFNAATVAKGGAA